MESFHYDRIQNIFFFIVFFFGTGHNILVFRQRHFNYVFAVVTALFCSKPGIRGNAMIVILLSTNKCPWAAEAGHLAALGQL